MKRIILGLVMVSGLALWPLQWLTPPLSASAARAMRSKCTALSPTPRRLRRSHYIAGVGEINFSAAGTHGATRLYRQPPCELIYNDNDFGTLIGGPAACYVAVSVARRRRPVLRRRQPPEVTGTLSPSAFRRRCGRPWDRFPVSLG